MTMRHSLAWPCQAKPVHGLAEKAVPNAPAPRLPRSIPPRSLRLVSCEAHSEACEPPLDCPNGHNRGGTKPCRQQKRKRIAQAGSPNQRAYQTSLSREEPHLEVPSVPSTWLPARACQASGSGHGLGRAGASERAAEKMTTRKTQID